MRARLAGRVTDAASTHSRSNSTLPDSREGTPVQASGSPKLASVAALKNEGVDPTRPPSALGKRKADDDTVVAPALVPPADGSASPVLGLKRVKSEPGEEVIAVQ